MPGSIIIFRLTIRLPDNSMKELLLVISLIILPLASKAEVQPYESGLDGLLKDYVQPVKKDGIEYNGVNYDAWGKDTRHAEVRDAILSTDPASLSSREEKMAYWINAYNVLTIDLITTSDEQESIKNLGNIFNSPWDKHTWDIAGKAHSLNHIEHDIIRSMNEPRIHFAVNCAAKSCPDLRAEAYRADKLDAQLEEQTVLTLDNPSKGYNRGNDGIVSVTKIMDWYEEDFDNGDLNKWLQTYKPDEVATTTKIRFFDYDWSLNAS